MIDLYTWTTPNGRKVSIMLEECGLDYQIFPIDITTNKEQFEPSFLEISPNNRIPAIVDHDSGASMMESGAILIYLAEKTGKFLPSDAAGRYKAIEWLMWQMGGLGPMAGQAHHFLKFNPGVAPYAEQRYGDEAKRLYGVMERQLADNEFLAGDYSIADMATWPWVSRFEWQQINLQTFPNVMRWYKSIAGRDAVKRGYDVPKYTTDIPMP